MGGGILIIPALIFFANFPTKLALGTSLGLLPPEGQSLILAGALLSITLNPFIFNTIEPVSRWIAARPKLLQALERPAGIAAAPSESLKPPLRDHAVIVGYGRVGGTIGEALTKQGIPYTVVEEDRVTVEKLRRKGVPAIYGDGRSSFRTGRDSLRVLWATVQ